MTIVTSFCPIQQPNLSKAREPDLLMFELMFSFQFTRQNQNILTQNMMNVPCQSQLLMNLYDSATQNKKYRGDEFILSGI